MKKFGLLAKPRNSIAALQDNNLVRELHHFKSPRPEIVIGNNAALLGTLSSLQKHGKRAHPALKIICPPFWLDSISKSYHHENWGQTIYGLPRIARQIFTSMFESHDDKEFIKWIQYQTLREKIINDLQTIFDVPVYYGTPSISKNHHGDFQIDVSYRGVSQSLSAPSSTHFYSWYRSPKQHSLKRVIQRPSYEIYQQPRELIPETNIVTLGASLSTVWLAKHLSTPKRNIICIKFKNDKIPKIPSNSDTHYDRIIMLNYEDVEIVPIIDPNESPTKPSDIVLIRSEGKEFTGMFYSAIGFENAKIPGIESVDPKSVTQLGIPKSKWVATKDVPTGSLMHSFTMWHEQTNNYDSFFEPQNYHLHTFPIFFMENISVPILPAFFNELERTLIDSDKPLPENLETKLLAKIYSDTCNPTPSELSKFESDLTNLLERRLANPNSFNPM